jgi:hypothetical protein
MFLFIYYYENQFGRGRLHICCNLFDFGFKFEEIFVIENRLPAFNDAQVSKISAERWKKTIATLIFQKNFFYLCSNCSNFNISKRKFLCNMWFLSVCWCRLHCSSFQSWVPPWPSPTVHINILFNIQKHTM